MESSVYVTLEIYEEIWKEVAEYPLTKFCILVGRSKTLLKSGDILIDDTIGDIEIVNKISAIHCSFYKRSQTEKDRFYHYSAVIGYAVRDGYTTKSSTNGTFLNGKKLEKKTNLNDKDVITIGQKIRLIYHQSLGKNQISDDLNDTYTSNQESDYVEKNNKK